jgi:hypothetical protein
MFQRLIMCTAVIALAACGSNVEKRACMKTGTSDVLVTDAALIRLDIYGQSARCSGSNVAAGAGAPLMSHTFAKGAAITLDVPPGAHAIVLSTFADASGTVILGQGCADETLTPGAEVCFDLALVRVADMTVPDDLSTLPDLAMPPPPPDLAEGPDLAKPPVLCDAATGLVCTGGTTCCNKQCVDTTSNVGNCGGCGNACDQTNSFGAQCSASTCVYTNCRTGYSDCDTTPPNIGGCETHTDVDAVNCGACGRACKTSPNVATAMCSAGVCTSTCSGTFANCSHPAAPAADDGCETDTSADINNCGMCKKTCSFANAAASCSASTCHMGACSSGYFDCDQSSTTGCEAAGYDFGGGKGCCSGVTPATSGTAMIAHNNGLLMAPQGTSTTFYDCLPLATAKMNGTYSQQLAQDAADQSSYYSGSYPPFSSTCTIKNSNQSSICIQTPTVGICWAYTGTTTKENGQSFPSGYVDFNAVVGDTSGTPALENIYCPSPDYDPADDTWE